MLERNVGNLDRAVRLVLAFALFSLFFLVEGPLAWLGLIGVVPLVTGLVGACPLYRLFGVRTCALRDRSA